MQLAQVIFCAKVTLVSKAEGNKHSLSSFWISALITIFLLLQLIVSNPL